MSDKTEAQELQEILEEDEAGRKGKMIMRYSSIAQGLRQAYLLSFWVNGIGSLTRCPFCTATNDDSGEMVDHMNEKHPRKDERPWILTINGRPGTTDIYHIAQVEHHLYKSMTKKAEREVEGFLKDE